ncbi:MAG: prepilin-type N-terminal cleavage/methylation domain-containing protein [bacterium]|nr:prepilin-type N-terminal cleavage/methylation domain-containing protein [Myxococcales bacterium]MCB9553553.1 prepilin-type N-terminal cleavage/methylation domain-containing protein [Myxococcales bacterium]
MTRIGNRTRGFTLVELMIVVVIIGVLAVLAITGYRKYTYAARNAEAQQFLGAVRAAQQMYFEAFGRYCGEVNPDLWPAEMPNGETGKINWDSPDNPLPEDNAWYQLGIRSPGRVWFQYSLAAGEPGENGGRAIRDNRKHWFWAQANGDFNADGTTSTFEVTSEKADVYIENENE